MCTLLLFSYKVNIKLIVNEGSTLDESLMRRTLECIRLNLHY